MIEMDLALLRHELAQLARRGRPILAPDLAGAILDVYGPEVAEAVCDALRKGIDGARKSQERHGKPHDRTRHG